MHSREPVALGLSVCDSIVVNPETNKWSLPRLCTRLTADSFPYTVPHLAIYVCLTDCHGRLTLTIRIADVDEERPALLDMNVSFTAKSPLDQTQLDLTAQGLTCPAPGVYRIQLVHARKLLIEQRQIVGPKSNQTTSSGAKVGYRR